MDKPSITQDTLDKIANHAKFESRMEACGLLTGNGSNITGYMPGCNILHSPIEFEICENDFIYMRNKINELNLQWIGIYHSHLMDSSYPSDKDIRMMSWNVYYMVVSYTPTFNYTFYYKDKGNLFIFTY